MPSSRRFRLVVAVSLGLAATLARASAYTTDDFFHAIEVDDGRGVVKMLGQGMDPNLRDGHGQSALYVALRGESLKAAKALWEAPGLELDAPNGAGETALMMAALRGEVEAAGALVAHGAQVQRDGWSPLHYAATGGKVAIIQMLLQHGAGLESRSPNGTTPLMMAARYGSEEAVDALLAAGADRTAKNDQGMDAAAFAEGVGREYLLKRLRSPQAAR